jgi:CBS domain-containing protein
MQIREIMTPQVEVIYADATLKEAAKKMSQLNVGLLPVCDSDLLLGMITDRDITVRATAAGCDPNTTKVCDTMTPEVVYCFEDQDVNTAMQIMDRRQIRRILVVDHDKQLAGIVSLGDLAVAARDQAQIGEILESISEPAEFDY